MNLVKRGISFLILIICLLGMFFTLFSFGSLRVYAGGTPENLSEECLAAAKEAWDCCISLGMTEAAAAGVLGNADQESGFSLTSWDGSDLSMSNGGAGYFGMTYDPTSCVNWCNSNNLNPDKISSQIKYIFAEECCVQEFVTRGSQSGKDAYKQMKDIKEATTEFCVCFEYCYITEESNVDENDAEAYGTYWQELKTRWEYAEAFYTLYTGSAPSTNSGSDTGSNIPLANGASGIFTINGYKLLDESYYTPNNHLNESSLMLPSVDSLSFLERTELSNWRNSLELTKEDETYRLPRVIFMIIGILITIYSILLFFAFQFDRVNNFVEISLLEILTFKQLRTSPDDKQSTFSNKESPQKVVVLKDMVVICIIGVTIGVLLISGSVFGLVGKILNLINDFFVNIFS